MPRTTQASKTPRSRLPVRKTPRTRTPIPTPRAERSFTFVDLPPEVRDLIYAYVLTSPHTLEIAPLQPNTKAPSRPSNKRPPIRSTPSVPGVALLRTCKEIRTKATPHLYANELSFSAQHLCQFLALLQSQTRKAITNLSMTYTMTAPLSARPPRCQTCDEWLVATNGIARIDVHDETGRPSYGYLMAVETFEFFRCWVEGQAVETGRTDAALEKVFWKGFACDEWEGLGEAFAETLRDLMGQCVGRGMVEVVDVVAEAD